MFSEKNILQMETVCPQLRFDLIKLKNFLLPDCGVYLSLVMSFRQQCFSNFHSPIKL